MASLIIKNKSPYSDEEVKVAIKVCAKLVGIKAKECEYNFKTKRVSKNVIDTYKAGKIPVDQFNNWCQHIDNYNRGWYLHSRDWFEADKAMITMISGELLPLRGFVKILLHEMGHHKTKHLRKLREMHARAFENHVDEAYDKIQEKLVKEVIQK